MEPHYAMLANELNERHQYYNMMSPTTTPPLPPPKPKTKFLKSPLVAIKNAFSKAKKPLRRQSSMVEPAELHHQQRQQKSMQLRRQHSMLEQRIQYDMMTQHQHQHHQQPRILSPEQQQYASEYNQRVQEYLMSHEPFYPKQMQSHDDSTYQCLQSEAIYGNCAGRNYYEQEHLYANRALIELNQTSDGRSNGRRIVRRHSMADRTGSHHQDRKDGHQQSRQQINQQPEQSSPHFLQQDDIYQTRSGAFLLQQQRNNKPPLQQLARGRSEDEPIYQSRREMHRNHLYQTKSEMQQRIHQGRIETAADRSASESPSSPAHVDRSSNSNTDSSCSNRNVSAMNYEIGGSDPLYQSRKELKEKGFRTRTELRDHIYQSRMEAMRSLAEPVYVSRKDSIMRRDESSSSSDGGGGGGRKSGTPSRSVTFGKDDILNEETILPQQKCNLDVVKRQNDENEKTDDNASSSDDRHNSQDNNAAADDDGDDDTLTNGNQSDLQKASTSINDTTITSCMLKTTPLSPRAQHAPFHISKIIKRTAPPPVPLVHGENTDEISALNQQVAASRTSLETQYQSQASLPSGPPMAQSTPYASDGTLGGGGFPPPACEQSTTRGVFDENGGTLCDNIWNVSINIPKGAIPSGVKQEIYFTVTDPRLSQTVDGPPLDMENG